MTPQQPRDRRRTVLVPGQVARFVYLEPGFDPPFEQVTSVAVVPFLPDGRIVAALLDRGPDLPGGHVQEGERTPDETARREALEEAGITLGELTVAQVIQSDYYGSAPDELTYLIALTGLVAALHPFSESFESRGRAILEVEEFLAQYRAGDRQQMRRLVIAARQVLDQR